jgi:nucleoside-triphosphatase THEP1
VPDSSLLYAALLDIEDWLSQPRAITLLSGERGCGKTTACLRVIEAAQAAGVDVRGLVTPGRYAADGTRIAIDLVDPASGARWPLATRIVPKPVGGRQWRFQPEALARGSALLQASRDCDLLVIDEIGPLELEEGGGWVDALEILQAGRYRQALVVIRPSLRDVLIARLPGQVIRTLTVPSDPA